MAPKSVLDKVVAAIRAMKDHKGSSRQSIAKYLKAEFGTDNAAALRAALKKGVSAGTLVQDKQSFRVAGDAPIAEPEDERLEIEDLKVGEGDAAAAGDNITVAYRGTLPEAALRKAKRDCLKLQKIVQTLYMLSKRLRPC